MEISLILSVAFLVFGLGYLLGGVLGVATCDRRIEDIKRNRDFYFQKASSLECELLAEQDNSAHLRRFNRDLSNRNLELRQERDSLARVYKRAVATVIEQRKEIKRRKPQQGKDGRFIKKS